MPTILLNKIRKGGTAPKNIYVGNKEVKCVYKGSTLLYDTQKTTTTSNGTPTITYGTPEITISYGTISRNGGTATPTITVKQSKTTVTPVTTTPVGHSGNSYSSLATTTNSQSTETITVTSYTKSFSGSVQNSSGATINSSTGVVSRTTSLGTTYKASSWIVMNVTVSVTANGKSNTKTVSVYMESNTYTTSTSTSTTTKTYYDVHVTADPSDRNIAKAGETISFYPRASSSVVTTKTPTTTYTYQTGSTTSTTGTPTTTTSNAVTLATTTKVYLGGTLQTTRTVAANAAQTFDWTCPANNSSSARTVSCITSISESTEIATWENSQLGSSDVYTFAKRWDVIGYPATNTGSTVIATIDSYKNGSATNVVGATATSSQSWATPSVSTTNDTPYPGTIKVTLVIGKNTSGQSRSGTLTVTQTGSGNKLTYTFTQNA